MSCMNMQIDVSKVVALVGISTKNTPVQDLRRIQSSALKILRGGKNGERTRQTSKGFELPYDIRSGVCFGQYDILMEFSHSRTKVASSYACDIQRKIAELVRKRRIHPSCATLFLCYEVRSRIDVSQARAKAQGLMLS